MSIFKQYLIDCVFTLRLREMHERNQMVINYVFGEIRLKKFVNRSLGKPWSNAARRK